ncbi:MAG: NADH:flavin oxidoreductase, partial [Candidatus Thermoplasmatota archaeon]|nr:NADH:flavin oxidoreductase [Candidatus Thermoplasmatota archaeon]
GIDILHLSCWDITKKTHDGPDAVPITAEFCRKIGGEIPILTTGGIWDEDDVSEAFSQGADMLGVGRAGIAHPDWPTRVYTGDNTRPPFTRKQLSEADLSPVFIDYMCRWDGFVED